MKANTLEDFQKILVSLKPDATGCLLWPQRLGVDGYGAYKIRARQCRTHRLAWECALGAIPTGLCILHTCDVRRCVNIQHLRLGTWADNNRDRMRKGRSALGERAGRAKLTEKAVREIRALYALGKSTLDEIGKNFGVSGHQICQVVRYKSWGHVV